LIDVVVSGAAGRLGSRVVSAVEAETDMTLAATIGRHDDPAAAIVPGRILVETAPHVAAAQHLALAVNAGVPVVFASTGLDAKETTALEDATGEIPVVVAPNLSLGVTVLLDLVERASAALSKYDLEIVEMHHRRKVDAPSGTAWALAEAAARGRGQDVDRDAIVARSGDVGARSDSEIGIQTLRGGGVVGEHTVFVVGETERIELTHRAMSRDTFAAGAISAARFLGAGLPAGRYSMRDVLGLT
jgi:4-hydroxy-tetrahydrodipicolinate reductase